jgi:dTDP-glucose pyrophosphorylase
LKTKKREAKKLKIVITMAGLGARFKNAGYTVEKHEIMFHGKTLFEWAVGSLSNFREFEFIFVTRDFKGIDKFIEQKSRKIGLTKTQIIKINHVTKGQAETATLAKEFFDSDESILVYNTDTYVDSEKLLPSQIKGNGWIPVFSAGGDKWSFVEADRDGVALRVTEKERISDNCSVGLYYFDSFRKFDDLVASIGKEGASGRGEWYIAPLYNDFIKQGNKVYIQKIPAPSVMVLGTPEDLENAEKRFPFP